MSIAKFTKSPLTEVICGVEFNAPDFASVHFGLYWQTIRDRFPHPPLDRPPIGEIELLNILPTLRRVWFESDDRRQLIQLQANRFHYNWRQQDESDQYPHFHEIYPNFSQEWQKFEDWWLQTEKMPLQPIRYELTYLNQIDQRFGWNHSNDYPKIFNFLGQGWSELPLSSHAFNTNFEFDLPENRGVLSVSLNQGIRPKDSVSVVVLNLTASTTDTSIEIEKWFELAHQSTVNTFLSLISQEVKQEWGLKWLD
jgi:uncharacterized protein (TIGR04255 family)